MFYKHYLSSLLVSNIDATTNNLLASAAVTCNTSFSSIIKCSVKNCNVSLAVRVFVLNKLNLSAVAGSPLNKSTVKVLPLPLSSLTNNDFTIALEFDGTVYKVVTVAAVKSSFAFLYIFAIYPNPNNVYLSEFSFNCVKNVEFNCSTTVDNALLICLWLSSVYSFLGSGLRDDATSTGGCGGDVINNIVSYVFVMFF